LTDIFRRQNCARVWYYDDGVLSAIGIWVFDEASSSGDVVPAKLSSMKTAEPKNNNVDKNKVRPKRSLQEVKGKQPLDRRDKLTLLKITAVRVIIL